MTIYTGLQYSDTNTATLAGLVQDIYYQSKSNASSISAGDMNRIVNKYYAQVQSAIKAVNENFYLFEATTDITIGDGSVTFPDGTGTAPAYEKIKSIWVAFNPTVKNAPVASDYTRVQIVDPDSIDDPAYTFSEESPKAIMYGTYFVLLPLVTDATLYPVTDGIKMNYVGTQKSLVNATDVPLIFPGFHDSIVIGSLIDVQARLGNIDASEQAKVDFKARLEDIKAYASDHLPLELGVVEGQERAGGWEYPWGFNSMS